jgi:hypothetical protein
MISIRLGLSIIRAIAVALSKPTARLSDKIILLPLRLLNQRGSKPDTVEFCCI